MYCSVVYVYACNSAGVEKERFVKFTTELCYRFFPAEKNIKSDLRRDKNEKSPPCRE